MNIKKFIKDIDNVHSQLDNYTHSTYSKTYKFTVWYNKKYGTLTVILDNDDQITGAVLEFYGERVQTMENNTNMKKLAEEKQSDRFLPLSKRLFLCLFLFNIQSFCKKNGQKIEDYVL